VVRALDSRCGGVSCFVVGRMCLSERASSRHGAWLSSACAYSLQWWFCISGLHVCACEDSSSEQCGPGLALVRTANMHDRSCVIFGELYVLA
jgi:hypothetical protein